MKELGWLRSLALSGLFVGAQRLAEGIQGTEGYLGLSAASTAVAASVVSSYLVNRANSQWEAQRHTDRRQKLAQRNDYLRRGMAAALRHGLTQARREMCDLPSEPYHALFSSWDYLLGLAESEEGILERFFPIQFTELHWEATDPYSTNLDEDAKALAGLLRTLLEADAVRKNWSEEQALNFSRLALPFYRQAFAEALAADSDGFLYRAFEVKGNNQIRALVQQVLVENRGLHAQTHKLLNDLRRDLIRPPSFSFRSIQAFRSEIIDAKRISSPIVFPGIGLMQTQDFGVPANYLELIPHDLDPMIRPEIYGGVLRKLREDFRQGALSAPVKYKKAHQKAEADLRPISHKADHERLAFLDLAAICDQSWWGRPQQHSINILRNTIEILGRPMLISCSSVNVAAYAVLKGFHRHGISSEIIPDEASGREQAISLAANPRVDFVVCADAPLFLDPHDNIRAYSKIFEIYNESQVILRKTGLITVDTPKVFVYQASSAKQQFLLERARTNDSPLPDNLQEEPLINMADFALVSDVMDASDMVIAWGALKESLLKDSSLVKVKGGDFALTVSMFRHPSWDAMTKALESFLDLFVAEWNFCQCHEKLSFERLVTDQRFMDSFARGGGFKTKFHWQSEIKTIADFG